MSYGCDPPSRFGTALLSAAVLCVVAVAVVHWPAIARSDGAGSVSRASARISLVIPSTEVRRAIAESCADEAGAGYVPIVEVDADEVGVPGEGRFFRCPSGARVFLVPTGR